MIKYYLSKLFAKIFGLSSVKSSKIHPTGKIGNRCSVTASKIGKFSYAGDNTHITHAMIGNFTSISSYCTIGGGEHPMNWVSTSPVFTAHRSILRKNLAQHPFNPYKETHIGNDVWIGTHCLIKSGVHIADGAIIGMGSVVTKDVGPYEIWAGNPARMIRKRFDDETITRLHALEWWNWDDAEILRYADVFNDPQELFKRLDAKK